MNGVMTEAVKLTYGSSRLLCLAITWLSTLSSQTLWKARLSEILLSLGPILQTDSSEDFKIIR